MSKPITIHRYLDIDVMAERTSEIDRVFFESSSTKTFDSDEIRAAFRERWLGRYLRHDAKFAYVAQTTDGTIVGYLVGAIDDPAITSRFADIAYFAALSAKTKHFPAHLHVNVRSDFRDRGIGAQLVDRFVADAKAAGAPGVHVVTSVGAANVSFYNRNHFEEVARAGAGGRLVFLARAL